LSGAIIGFSPNNRHINMPENWLSQSVTWRVKGLLWGMFGEWRFEGEWSKWTIVFLLLCVMRAGLYFRLGPREGGRLMFNPFSTSGSYMSQRKPVLCTSGSYMSH
jgi:hypothetical protein